MADEKLKKKIEELEIEIQYYKNIAVQAGNIRLRENEEFSKLILKNRQTELELKSTNTALQESLEKLKKTQAQLIESEKNAALSVLVAGVAHEINTPIGVSITAASHLEDKGKLFFSKVEGSGISREDFNEYKSSTLSSTEMLLSNLMRAADLIKSFKQVAVDQIKDEKRKFDLRAYFKEVLKSLQPEYKRVVDEVLLFCEEDIIICSYPGVFSQIITNLIMNSLIHGFEGKAEGEISIKIEESHDFLTIIYKDNGKGMSSESLKKIFDPFYTTKRGKGGTGLGMHIVYNLVRQKLEGQIKCNSIKGKGINITILIPISNISIS